MNIVWENEEVKHVTMDTWYSELSIACFVLVILLNLLKL